MARMGICITGTLMNLTGQPLSCYNNLSREDYFSSPNHSGSFLLPNIILTD